MAEHTIVNILRNAEIDLGFVELRTQGLVWRTVHQDRGHRMFAVRGGIGAFLEDCRILFSTLALAESAVLD